MHEYDTVLKRLLCRSSNSILERMLEAPVAEWINVELPLVQQPRVDLLCRLTNGGLVHIELQSTNDAQMPLRMAEYSLQIFRLFKRLPLQIVLYVGNEKMTMLNELKGLHHNCRFSIVDLRELDAEPLLNSPRIADNVLAILMKLRDRNAAVKQVLESIGRLEGAAREEALSEFLILSGLRRLSPTVSRQVRQMPILNDIMEHEVLGPVLRKGLEEGLEQGLERGLEQGLERGLERGLEQGEHQGRVKLLRRQIEKRFGALPSWAEQRLDQLSNPQLEQLADRVLDAPNLDQLFLF